MATLAVTAVIKKVEHKNGRMLFLQVDDLNMKINDLFRSLIQPLHHKGETPFLVLNVDMISDFPHDYMHAVC